MGTSGPGLLYVTGPFVFGFDVKAGTRLTLKLGSVQLVNTQSPAPMPVAGQFVLSMHNLSCSRHLMLASRCSYKSVRRWTSPIRQRGRFRIRGRRDPKIDC